MISTFPKWLTAHGRGSSAAGLMLVNLALGAIPAAAQDDGPRAYLPAPTDIFAISAQYIRLESNQPFASGVVLKGVDISGDIGVFQVAKPLDISGIMVAPLVILPIGEVEGDFQTTRLGFDAASSDISTSDQVVTGRSSGLGDIEVGAVIGLVGVPPMSSEEYIQHDPGFSLGLLGRLTLPTGEYSEDRLINLGANRWGGMVGFPMAYCRGTSFLDPALTTFELVPVIQFFGTNEEPLGAGATEQDPIFALEAHLTQNFGSKLWASIDARYRYGGETSTDGQPGDDRQEALALGATLGLSLTRNISFKATYGEIVSRNDDGPDGHMFRAVVGFNF